MQQGRNSQIPWHIVGVNIFLVFFTHLYINLGFVISRYVTLYVSKIGNLSMSIVYSSIKKQLITKYFVFGIFELYSSHNFKLEDKAHSNNLNQTLS
jgi:hypothetical protein